MICGVQLSNYKKISFYLANECNKEGSALENDKPSNEDTDEKADLHNLRTQLQKIYEEEDDAIRFRTGLDVIEKGEKITPFFFRTIDMNHKESNILKLKTDSHPNGTISKKETMDAIQDHYAKIFSDPDRDKEIPDEWFDGIAKVPEAVSATLDANITPNDLTTALFKLMCEGRSPGNDGLSTSFYRAFWAEISGMVTSSLREGWEKGKFSNSQRQSVIRMIEKKGKDKETIGGWRPISLMNADIKMLAKVIAERLKVVCKHVIGEEQLAYIEGNNIHEGHLFINRAPEMARSKRLKGLMTCIDFKQAFDSVRHKFI